MQTWLRRARGAIGMGITWGVAWAAAGVLIGVASTLLPWLPWNAFLSVFDAPLPALAIPGFFGGVLFSAVLGIAARRRTFTELSVLRFGAWGAIGGLLLSLLPAALFLGGLADTTGASVNQWQIIAAIGGPFTVLSAISAAASLMLARRAAQRETIVPCDDNSNLEPGDGEPRVLHGGAVLEPANYVSQTADKV